MPKILREWFLEVPWGKVALISWGNPNGVPVLLVHGRLDSAATFVPLLELLPDTYHYVAFDLPGHGKSDPFPMGVALQRIAGVAVVELVVRHLGWRGFTYVGHSMGAELGMFFSVLCREYVEKLVILEPGQVDASELGEHYRRYYDSYYRTYGGDAGGGRTYTRQQAVDAVRRNRDVSEGLAELVLSRNLNRLADDKYRLSWDRRLKLIAPLHLPLEYYEYLLEVLPPTLVVCARHSPFRAAGAATSAGRELLRHLGRRATVVWVDGGHDVHLTHPERCADAINTFLTRPHAISKI